MFIKRISTLVTIATFVGLAAGPARADLFPDFTVDPDRNPLTLNSFVADKAIGGYVEVINFSGSATAGTFSYALRWVAGQYFSNEGTSALAAGDTGLGVNYNLYALVTGSGGYVRDTITGKTAFTTAVGGTVQLYYDSPRNTLFTNSGGAIIDQATLFQRSGNLDDLPFLSAGSAISGFGTLEPGLSTCAPTGLGINCGSFGQTSSILLNADGRSYFTQPVPFYTVAFNSGQLNNFNVTGTQVINGSMDLSFNVVPEPSALALVGVALMGLGLSRRRRENK